MHLLVLMIFQVMIGSISPTNFTGIQCIMIHKYACHVVKINALILMLRLEHISIK